jgi:hypothetical protein
MSVIKKASLSGNDSVSAEVPARHKKLATSLQQRYKRGPTLGHSRKLIPTHRPSDRSRATHWVLLSEATGRSETCAFSCQAYESRCSGISCRPDLRNSHALLLRCLINLAAEALGLRLRPRQSTTWSVGDWSIAIRRDQ